MVNPYILSLLKEKASHSSCTYRIAAIAFDKKGDILGHVTNKHSSWNVVEKFDGEGRAGTAKHAERLLISRYGKNIKNILICRIGHNGEFRPIDACPTCKKAAAKYGIKIHSIKVD